MIGGEQWTGDLLVWSVHRALNWSKGFWLYTRKNCSSGEEGKNFPRPILEGKKNVLLELLRCS